MRRISPLALLLAACNLFLGSEEQLNLALLAIARAPPPMEVAGALFVPARVVLRREVRELRSRRQATVFAHADVDGTLDGVEVRALGPERIRLVRAESGWTVDGPLLPGLRGILETLRGRQKALQAHDVAAYARLLDDAYSDAGVDRAEAVRRLERLLIEGAALERLRIKAWLVRAEKDTAQVREEYDVPEAKPGQRSPVRKAAMLTLVRREGGWHIARGLH